MMRKAVLLLSLVLVALAGAGVAAAATRQAASTQYDNPPVIGAGTTTTAPPTTTTTPSTTTGTTETTEPGETTTTSEPEEPGTPATTEDGPTTTATEGEGAQAPANPTKAAATAAVPGVALLSFGLADGPVRDDVAAAVAIAGLRTLPLDDLTARRLDAFLDSPLLKRLGDSDRAAGRALAAQLVTGTPLAREAFAALFPGATFVPLTRAVVTRSPKLTDRQEAFLLGIAAGLHSSGVPAAYAELSDADPSFVKDFRELGLLTVKDVDTPAGKQRLAQILLGQVTTQKAVNAVLADRTAAPVVDGDGSAGAAPWLLLVALVGGAVMFVVGPARRRLGRRPS